MSAPRSEPWEVRRVSYAPSTYDIRERQSEQQLFAGGVPHFQVGRRQNSKLSYDGLTNTEPDKFRLDGWEDGIMTIGPGPLPQHGKLLGLALQFQQDSRQKHPKKIFEGNILLEVDRISGITGRSIDTFVIDWLVKKLARFVTAEVVGHAADNLLQMVQEFPTVCKELALDGTASPRRMGAELNSRYGSIDEFLTTGASQVSRQSRVVSQVSQKALSQPGELPPLFMRYRPKRLGHIRKGSISLLQLSRFRSFRLHSKTRVWRVFGIGGHSGDCGADGPARKLNRTELTSL
jgi:hypothetical protein